MQTSLNNPILGWVKIECKVVARCIAKPLAKCILLKWTSLVKWKTCSCCKDWPRNLYLDPNGCIWRCLRDKDEDHSTIHLMKNGPKKPRGIKLSAYKKIESYLYCWQYVANMNLLCGFCFRFDFRIRFRLTTGKIGTVFIFGEMERRWTVLQDR